MIRVNSVRRLAEPSATLGTIRSSPGVDGGRKRQRTIVQFSKQDGSGRQPRPIPLSERGTGVHSDMEKWTEIRREVLTGALSNRATIATYGVGWRTLKKMLPHDEPPGYHGVFAPNHPLRPPVTASAIGNTGMPAGTSTCGPRGQRSCNQKVAEHCDLRSSLPSVSRPLVRTASPSPTPPAYGCPRPGRLGWRGLRRRNYDFFASERGFGWHITVPKVNLAARLKASPAAPTIPTAAQSIAA